MKIMSVGQATVRAIKTTAKSGVRKSVIGIWNFTNPKAKRKEPDYCTCSPDYVFGTYIGGCCHRHDDDCAAAKNAAEKLKADYKIRRCIYRTLRHAGRSKFFARLIGKIYYRGVRIGNFFGVGVYYGKSNKSCSQKNSTTES